MLNEIEIQELQKPVAGEIFDNICHRRTLIINGIVNEIEIQEQRKIAAGDFFIVFAPVVHKSIMKS